MKSISEEFLQQMFLAVLRIKYEVKEASFKDNDTVISFKLPGTKDVKQVTPQFFNYKTDKFVCNTETFKGEVGVMTMTNTYATMSNAKKLKKAIRLHKEEVSKNGHGDWQISFEFVNDVVKIIAKA